MSLRERLDKVLADLPERRLCEVFDFARYLLWLEQRDREEREDWQRCGLAELANAEGPDEPEYTEADFKPEHHS
jgi:hypothetical protein